MKAVLSNGDTREICISSPTMGLRVDSLVLNSSDLRKLLELNDGQLREWLSILTTRFGPEK
jgi:hypothetical protein